VDPSSGIGIDLSEYIDPFIKIIRPYKASVLIDFARREAGRHPVFPIFKSAPGLISGSMSGVANNFSSSPINVLYAIRALVRVPALMASISFLTKFFANTVLRGIVLFAINNNLNGHIRKPVILNQYSGARGVLTPDNRLPELGRLSVKEEAAGKMRVFAMVDPLTQWTLNPLHAALFHLLRPLPMDGTFNQTAPLTRMEFGSSGGLWSVDLTAATDRMPMALQVALIEKLFESQEMANA